eukprot:TRINITY_DN736_c0_g1_i1.p1 TRINITY_DN736_c0_g1~~TRINITY_DN736_c0_g1_i1.p1  ORF type:complete len:498 (-),score=121.44 TRINITY_DN736_c0_g1_i1:26-1519(-)
MAFDFNKTLFVSFLFLISSSFVFCFEIKVVPTATLQVENPWIPVVITHGGKPGLAKLSQLDINFDHYRTKEEIGAFVTQKQLDELKRLNFTFRVTTKEMEQERESARAFFRRVAENNKKRSLSPQVELNTSCVGLDLSFNREFVDYHDTAALESFMRRVNCAFPSITSLFSIGKSNEGRELLVMQITKNPGKNEAEPKFKYIANMHGDEVVGRENVLRLILFLCQEYQAGSVRYTRLIDTTDIYLMPTMNPDGFQHGMRYNSLFVDLNRNFPDQFRRSYARIEKETAAVMEWSKTKNFVLSANFHGGSVVANYPWDGNSVGRSGVYSASPDDPTFVHLAMTYSLNHRKMSRSSEFPNGIVNGAAWYILYGGMQDWNYVELGNMEITIELSDQKWPPADTLEEFWQDNKEAMVKYIEAVHTGFKGTVKDAVTKQPLAATIMVQGINHAVKTDPHFGDYYRLIVPGTYEVIATAPNKKSSIPKSVRVVDGTVAVLDFEL